MRGKNIKIGSHFFLTLLFFVSTAFTLNSYAQKSRELVQENDGKVSQKRLALIIGNASYKSAPLRNPVNDANDMARALRSLGFTVQLHTDINQNQMKRAIRNFGRKLREQKATGLFYFAGHGVQVKGKNYLIPVGAKVETEEEVEYEGVDVGLLLAQMKSARNGMNIVILDACRNNPFTRSYRSAEKGLASIDAPSGTIIAYATAPGSVAADGTGRNGLYTQELLKEIKKPGLAIESVFKRVRVSVREQTNAKQTPWESSSLTGEFYFADKGSSALAENNAPDEGKGFSNLNDDEDESFKDGVGKITISEVNSGGVHKNSFGMELVFIPPGEFYMGSPPEEKYGREDERPQRYIFINEAFWIGKYEVTQEIFEKLIGRNPSKNKCSKCPVDSVSWFDAKEFINKLNQEDEGFVYSLPSEAEWEYAARAGTETAFAFGDSLTADQATIFDLDYYERTKNRRYENPTPVGSYKPNAWGLYDMHGNVWEWCEDIYNKNYEGLPKDGLANLLIGDKQKRVLRGGSFMQESFNARSAERIGVSPTNLSYRPGFRVVAHLSFEESK